jgi:imidazolonepropionase-like amidohydrolase
MAVAAVIREALAKTHRYIQDIEKAKAEDGDMPEYDIKSEALIPLLEGKIKAHFHCHRADDIFTAIRLAKEFGLEYTLVHCTDGYLIADELAEEKCSAVVGPVICDRCKPEMASLSPENAAILAKSGVKVAVCTDHSEVPIEYLPISVGICCKHGLGFEDAVLSVTRNAAEIAGIADRAGSIEVGKDADLVMFEGDPFEVMSSPAMVMIGGEIQ